MTKKRSEASRFGKKDIKSKKRLGKAGFVATIVILLVAAYFVVFGIKIIRLNQEMEEAEARKQELLDTRENLTAQYENINSPQYIERLARRDLKMVKSNELLFILPEETQERQQNRDGEAEN